MSSERLEGIEAKVNVLVQAIQDELSYQLPRKNGGTLIYRKLVSRHCTSMLCGT